MPHNAGQAESGTGVGNIRTPPVLGDEIIWRYGLDYDAFAEHENALLPNYSTIEGTFFNGEKASDEDGFNFSWESLGVFLNPPYNKGLINKAIEKCILERNRARIIVALLMADTSTNYWRHRVVRFAESIQYLPRVHYWKPDGSGAIIGTPNFGSAIVVFGRDEWPVNG